MSDFDLLSPVPGGPKWVIGVCAMDTKARSKPMRNILNRLVSTGHFEAVIFGDKVILDEAVENWPSCDFLISFFSSGFPLEKAIRYVKLRQPFCVNDLPMQQLLWDRRLVLMILDKVGVPTPRRLISHTGNGPFLSEDILERLDNLGIKVPTDPQPHVVPELINNDTLKVGDQTIKKPFVEKPVSGEDHNVYIYYSSAMGGGVRKLFRKVGNKSSEFCPDVVDIRRDGSYIYEEFMNVDNAEDVKVYTVGDRYTHAETRKSPVVDGVVRRNAEGKEVRYITALTDEEKEMAKRVTVAFGQTVCGFDLLRADGKSYVIDVNGWSFVKGNDDYYDKCCSTLRQIFLEHTTTLKPGKLNKEPSIENQWKLKAFLSVMRHADRTPKQKMKFVFGSKPFVDLLNGQEGEVVFKKLEQLNKVAEACRIALETKSEDEATLQQLREVLAAKSRFSGTKAQIKPQFNKSNKTLEKVQLIVKWGGEFTHGGRHQTKEIGENYRKDLMLINKDLLDDVQIYSSSEQRVTATADFFVRYFLKLDDVPKNIIVVSKEMLDDSNAVKEQTESLKGRIQRILNGEELTEDGSVDSAAAKSAELDETIDILRKLRNVMREKFTKLDVDVIQRRWCCSETPMLFKERWEKMMKDFCDVERKSFDPSKISELYDSLKYDLIHNRDFCMTIFGATEGSDLVKQLYAKSKAMFDFVAPKEYGIENEEKLEIGVLSSVALLRQLVADLQLARSSPKPSARFYFTKESKIIALLNIVLLCGLPTRIGKVDELDYLTQITFELYERARGLGTEDDEQLAREYSLRIGFSQGAHHAELVDLHLDSKHSLSVAPRIWISDHVSLDEALGYLTPRMNGSPVPPK
ncbi:histidine phosphatase superfamily-domain-containing protein [Fimicolochytrium jonesii]|uniref:histidine phosphatase superfamily-domain-containing protein n=1 Tax=Fimicolochytrium jonesii TaxID=1396493 RepID=UPI0022FE9848|nr:histidine phosphatase superfamily-domain-containing protein [Fimicolochytrium jonesii]KAI8824538.1 histidine phosphatase superfamily-domain-containing protein [Fimicolochytrium jonesii]